MKLEVEKKTELLVREIQNSKKLTADQKGDMQDILLHAAEGTNGLTQEAKLQNATESIFSLVCLMVQRVLDGEEGKLAGLYKMIAEVKWQITIISGIVATMLIFRPEIGNMIKEMLK